MRVLAIVPGTGSGFLDDNCLRDQMLVTELRWAGHEVSLVPLFLNMAGSALTADSPPLFYGALRVYLEQVGPVFRNMPAWFRRKLDSPSLLSATRKRMWRLSSRNTAEVALSVLRGESGAQERELDIFLRWLRRQPRPDVIHLHNVLLAGFAKRIRAEFGMPVICSVQDEVSWFSAMPDDVVSRMWAEIRARSRDISMFIVPSRAFAETMRDRIGMPQERIRSIHPAVDVPRNLPRPSGEGDVIWGVALDRGDMDGLVYVVNAFINVKSSPRCGRLRLCVLGGWGSISEIEKRPDWTAFRNALIERGWFRDIVFLPKTRKGAREAFLAEIGIFTPIRRRAPVFEQLSLEAMARGAAVLLPDEGANREMLEMSGGGRLFRPGERGALAAALGELASDADVRLAYARTGMEETPRMFSPDRMGREMIEAYQWTLSSMSRLG